MTNNLPAAAASPQPCETPGYPERSLYYRDEVKAAVNDALEHAAVITDSKFIAREDASLFIRGLKQE